MSLFSTALSNSENANALFPDGSAQAAYLDRMSSQALSEGLDFFSKGDLDKAITAFKRSVGLSPFSSQAINAYDYMAKAHLKKGDGKAAINAYQQSLRIDRSNAQTYLSLGNIHFSDKNYEEATRQYALAVKHDPSAANHYSLGQGYMAQGQYDEAQRQFQIVRDMTPADASAYDALGQVYAKQGQTEEAISAFDRALSLESNFWQALADKGYALADAGEITQAKEAAQTLSDNNSGLASTLSAYIYEKTAPEMTARYATSTFSSSLGARSLVSSLGLYLTNAGDTQTFSMIFQFNKPMDPVSVQNVTNWTIARSGGNGAQAYNFGFDIPATEVTLPYYPEGVSYNQTDMTATVLFKVAQNSTADGTIDPSHIQFTFRGQDVLGLAMNPLADQYSGFSGFA